jgi:dethiobiotin synthetase
VKGCLVTGTDTGVGKTVLAAAIVAALSARGLRVAPVKPVVTGLDDPEPGRPADHELLARAAGVRPQDVTSLTFGPAVSPHLAAELAGVAVEPGALVAAARSAADGADVVVGEGAGGLLAPITSGYLIRDYALDLGLPLIVAARPGLGTINHTLMTLESARAAGLRVLAVVLTPWPDDPDVVQTSNRETIAALGDIDVVTLPVVGLSIDELVIAGATLPLEEWFAL